MYGTCLFCNAALGANEQFEGVAGIAGNLRLPTDIDMRLAGLKRPPSANP